MAVESVDPLVAAPGPVWRLPAGALLLAVAVAVLSVLPFWDGLSRMWDWWINQPEYSHALLVPPIAAFLIWQQKEQLRRTAFVPGWSGVGLVLLGGLLLVVGQLGTVYTLIQYAYLITLYGLTLSFCGWRAFRLIVVPLLILLLMIPLPEFVMNNLSLKLQLFSSQIATFCLNALGVSAFAEGNVIDLGGYKLQVADACSGLRYLFPLMTLSFLVAYLYRGRLWKRIVLFVSSVPIAMIMNSLRIGAIGIMVDRWGAAMAEGALHEFQGWAVFMACTFLVLAEMVALNAIGREHVHWRQNFSLSLPPRSPVGNEARRRPLSSSFVAASVLVAVFIVVSYLVPRPAEIRPARASFVSFPMSLGEWHGRRNGLEGVYVEQLKFDDYLLADYTDSKGDVTNFYVAYYGSQRKGEAVHSPRSCLPGGGWNLEDFRRYPVRGVTVNGQPLTVNRYVIGQGQQRALVYYWFQQRGRVIDSEFEVKWYLFWDALTRHRTDGALVRLIADLPPGRSETDVDVALSAFAAQAVPHLEHFVPD